jgi:uncharacterized membrane protein
VRGAAVSVAGAAAAVLLAAVGTFVLRLSGTLGISDRLSRARWMGAVPLAVLLVLAVTAVAGSDAGLPSRPALLATGVVAVLAARRSPLLVSVVAGCVVYAAADAWL